MIREVQLQQGRYVIAGRRELRLISVQKKTPFLRKKPIQSQIYIQLMWSNVAILGPTGTDVTLLHYY
jgi:ATP-dependent protease Clp ATPase subunit